MREIANRESTLPPLDRLVVARGNRRQGIWTTLALPCLHGPATWLRPGLPARIALSKEVPPVLPGADGDGGRLRRMWCALGPAHIKRSNHALCASWTTGIRLRNCACDCPLSANHFCTNALWPTGTPNTTSPRSSSGPSPVHASAPTVSKSSSLMPALFQILVFPRLTWMPADLKSDRGKSLQREKGRRGRGCRPDMRRASHLDGGWHELVSELRAGPKHTTLA